ncbi:uncharacterized protein, YkwD family [Phocoenobacter uteri]|uniref:Uncharacterized protein, YkwD family n=1 Tax=Phocoenobacter uteri TaxID=146806 RepID=A0A379C7V5_9PAST|nr:CAP domain-containing protein [Phocoenobacter uteri]MDG6882100.1 hypothetical protein [Phocoenobacter uteri]SUB58249.1 uncharacterized protein, YkwD family [Phocoenobacter uteri]
MKIKLFTLSVVALLTACGSGSGSSSQDNSPNVAPSNAASHSDNSRKEENIPNIGKPQNSSNTSKSEESKNESEIVKSEEKPKKENSINVEEILNDKNDISEAEIEKPHSNEAAIDKKDFIIASPSMVSSSLWNSKSDKKIAALSAYDKAQVLKVLEKTNEYRKAVGKKPLVWDEKLAAYAQMRSQELVQHYSHTRPNGTESYSEIQITAGSVGENIAAGQGNAEEVSLGWKNSAGHYQNIISDHFDKIGIGFVRVPNKSDPQGYTYYWTQTFAGGNAESSYTFDKNHQPKEPEVINLLGKNIVLLDGNKLQLENGQEIVSNASKAYKERRLAHSIYSKSLQFSDDSFRAILQDPTKANFVYQTFGEIVDSNQAPVQYVNIGKPTVPDNIDIMEATYKGASLGSVRQGEHYYADVTATIRDKKMDVSLSNTRFDYKGEGEVYIFTPDSIQGRGLNFTEKNMQWNSANKRFEKQDDQGNHIFSHFYGPKGEEIGGQFSRDVEKLGRYNGVFGAKKQ